MSLHPSTLPACAYEIWAKFWYPGHTQFHMVTINKIPCFGGVLWAEHLLNILCSSPVFLIPVTFSNTDSGHLLLFFLVEASLICNIMVVSGVK